MQSGGDFDEFALPKHNFYNFFEYNIIKISTDIISHAVSYHIATLSRIVEEVHRSVAEGENWGKIPAQGSTVSGMCRNSLGASGQDHYCVSSSLLHRLAPATSLSAKEDCEASRVRKLLQ